MNEEKADPSAALGGPATAVGVFVSSQAIDAYPAAQLITWLKKAGATVEHSPSNPIHRPDPRWSGWYSHGLSAALRRCGLFVVVVDAGWDSSTWMAQEADLALVASETEKHLRGYVWNPERRQVTAAGMVGYLREQLPLEAEEAARFLVREAGIWS